MTEGQWPEWEGIDPTDALRLERAKEILKAEIELEKSKRSKTIAPEESGDETADYILRQLIDNMMSTSVASVERTRKGAEFIQVAATALGGLYTGILALMFSIEKNPLPPRGLIPTFFFGLAVVLATFYIAFLTTAQPVVEQRIAGTPVQRALGMANFLTLWIRNLNRNRVGALRGAVVSLTIGVALLPIGLVEFPADEGAGPTDSSSEIDWPTPPSVQPVEAAVVLYERQLDTFLEDRDAAPSVPRQSIALPFVNERLNEDGSGVVLAVVGLLIVAVTVAWRWPPRLPRL